MNYKHIFNGLKWASIELIFDSFVKLVLKLLLAKLLLPKDFGLIGMCLLFIGITQSLSQLGMSYALIQKKNDSDAVVMYHTAFWSNIVLALLLYVALAFFVSPIVAAFYGEPILTKVLPLLGLPIIIGPFTLIPITILTRRLDFKVMAKVFGITALISGIIAVIMAYYGFGVWSLVTNQICSVGFTAPILIFITKWKPKFEWKKDYFKNIFAFGIYSTGTSLTRSLMNNLDKLIIGKVLGTALLGAYTLAITLTDYLTNYLMRITNKVIYPVYSNYQDNDEKLRLFLVTIMKVNSLLIYPFMAVLINFGDYIIVQFFGTEWESAIVPLKIIAIAMMVNILANGFDAVLRAKGKPGLEFKIIAFINLLILVPFLYFGVGHLGIKGAALAIVINSIFLVTVANIFLRREIKLKPVEPLKAIKGSLFAVLCSSIVLELISDITSNIYFKVTLFLIIYSVIALWIEIKLIKKILSSIR